MFLTRTSRPFPGGGASVGPEDGVWVPEVAPPRGSLTACTGRRSRRSASCAGDTPGRRSPGGRIDAVGGRPAPRRPPRPDAAGDPAGTGGLHPARARGGRAAHRPALLSQAHAHRPSALGKPAHRVIQVQVRVKLGDEVVALVQLGHFPREPEDFGGPRGGGGGRRKDRSECWAHGEGPAAAASRSIYGGGDWR